VYPARIVPIRTAFALLLFAAGPAMAQTRSPQPPDEPTERVRTWCRGDVPRVARFFHIPAAAFDLEALCDRIVAKSAGLPIGQLEDLRNEEIQRIRFGFATPGAKHDPRARYRFPYEPWMPRLLSQTSGGQTHNTPDSYFAFDFLMPRRTRVLAARAGTVVAVADGSPEGVPWQEDAGNDVMVLHSDGTWAVYAHLEAGIPVKVGQKVKRGEFLAYSGNTGYSQTPHLHFGVQRMNRAGEILAVPIRFGQPGKPGRKLEEGRHYGQIPPSRRALRVTVDGKPSVQDVPMPIAWGARPSLRVERVDPDGSVTDVTCDERMRYETMTVWNLYSPERGKLVIEALPEIDPKYIRKALPLLNQSEGLLFVYYGLPWDADFGLAQVSFQVLPAKPR